MVDKHLIKKLREKQGKSLNEIVRITGFNFRTVKRYGDQLDFSTEVTCKQTRKRKIEKYRDTIDQWLKEDLKVHYKQRHTAKRVYTRLQEEYPENFDISYNSVCKYVKLVKSKLYQPKAYLPLTFYPGIAQVDFGTASYLETGIEKKCKYLILTFPFSNAYYYQAFKGENQECLLTGLQNIFHHLHGAPQEILFDNLSAAVVMKKGNRIKNDLFMKFEMHYGFEAVFCNPNAGHEKGNVENKVGYHRRNFMVPAPTINDFNEYNLKAFAAAEKDMERQHYKKQYSIKKLFEEDKSSLLDLSTFSFDVLRMFRARCDKYGKVQFAKRRYSVSPEFASMGVWLFISHDKVEIKDAEFYTIIVHDRMYGAENEAMNWLPYLKLIQKRPKALKYVDFFKTLPENWQSLFNSIDIEEQKEVFKVLTEILLEYSMDTAKEILLETQKYGACDAESLKLTLNRFKNSKIEIGKYEPENTPELPEFAFEWAEYNNLIVARV